MSLAILRFVNTIILPEYCIICGKSNSYICPKCIKFQVQVNFRNICHVCGNTTFLNSLHIECEDSTNLNRLIFFCEYNSVAKKIIESIKYGGSFFIIENLAIHMSKYMAFIFSQNELKDFVITYVPSHKFKKNQRGFNQSELLAQKIAKNLNMECRPMLTKVLNTKKQAGTNKSSRSTNLRNTFTPMTENVSKNVIIIDDVHTTGATLNECAGVLKSGGAKQVLGFVFAKSLNYSPIDSKTSDL